jgi:hypothetical protein
MSDALERTLEPGEEVRLELPVSGWPTLSWRAILVYGVLLVPLLCLVGPLADQGLIYTSAGGTRVVVPWVVPGFLAVIAAEVNRGARFRSSIWVVTTDRVYLWRGVRRLRCALAIPLSAVRRVEIAHGDPELVTKDGALILEGVGLSCLEDLRQVFARADHVAPRPTGPVARRSWRRERVFVSVALGLLGVVWTLGYLERRTLASSIAFLGKFRVAVAGATASTIKEIESPNGGPRTHLAQELPESNVGPTAARFVVTIQSYAVAPGAKSVGRKTNGPVTTLEGAGKDEGIRVAVEVRARSSTGLFPGEPTIEIEPTRAAPENDLFLRELKREFDAAGLLLPATSNTPAR